MLTRSISVSCADESLGFGDDRDLRVPDLSLAASLRLRARRASRRTRCRLPTRWCARAGVARAALNPSVRSALAPFFAHSNKPFFLKCKCLRLKDQLEHGINLRVIAVNDAFLTPPFFATNYA